MAAPPNVSGHSEWQRQNLTVAEVLCRGIRKSPALTCMVPSCCSAFSVLSDIQSQEYYWVQKESVKEVGRQQLRSWGILIERDGKDYPTNAYAILTGAGAFHTATQCGVFKGSTKEVFVDRREYDGPIWEQIEQAFQYVLRNIHLGANIVGIYRQDVYEIPPDAIRELIINAAVHRSYLDHGNIQIAIYDDRLEITSPGKLPMGQTLERMKEGYSQILSK